MRLHRQNPQNGRAIVGRYVCDVIIPLLRRIHDKPCGSSDREHAQNQSSHPTSSSVFGNEANSTAHSDNTTTEDDEHLDCYIVEDGQTETQRIQMKLLQELSEYRMEQYSSADCKLAWLAKARDKFPNVVTLANYVLGIPPTQIANERVFSIAGRIASPIRSSLSTESIDNIVSIAILEDVLGAC